MDAKAHVEPIRKPNYFVYKTRVAYHHTDAMGVVHHSNHIKFFEEARVEWLRDRGFMELHAPYGPYIFAVVKLENRYFKTARFDDVLEVRVQARVRGAKILFRYGLWSERLGTLIADGTTELVPVSEDLKLVRLPTEVIQVFNKEPWDETWDDRPAT